MRVENDAPSAFPNSINVPHSPVAGLPWTIYIWFAIIVATLLAPRVMERLGVEFERPRATREALTASEFERYIEAARNIRVAFAQSALQARLKTKGLPTNDIISAKQGADSLKKAIEQYGEMEKTSHVPNISRILLILDHAAGKPLDEERLGGKLPQALRDAKKNPEEIAAEESLWRTLYGDTKPASPAFLSQQEKMIRSFELHFLENRALTDLYRAYEDKAQAKATQTALDAEAVSYLGREAVFGLAVLAGIAAGIALLLFVVRAALLRRWSEIGRIAETAISPGYGTLIDAFAFFFAAVFTTRIVTGLIATYALPNPTVKTVIILSVTGYLIPAGLAFAYFAFRAQAQGSALESVGLTKRDWGKNILFGIAAYCAALPFTAALGLLSRWIFKHNPDVTPNPILPLIAAERDLSGRLMIFLLVAVAAPLVEEIFFRGILQTGLRVRYGAKWGILFSAVFFAIAHPMQDWLPILGLGLAFGTVRELRQSLIPGMMAHFIQNSLAFIAIASLFSN